VLIVGQGLAGTFLAHYLRQAGMQVLIIDNRHQGCASVEAAGLINPVTGRYFAKSWRIDELLPFAREAYRHQEVLLGIRCYYDRPIFRAFFSPKESNDWWARGSDPRFEPYFAPDADPWPFGHLCKPVHSYAAVNQSAQVDVRLFLQAFAEKAVEEGWLLRDRFDFSLLDVGIDSVRYGDIEPQYLVFCEGFGLKGNPFFGNLPMEGAKGEVLLLRIPGFPNDIVLKHKIFIAPLGGDLFWAGATYERDFADAGPSPEKAGFLKARVEEILRVPFQEVGHRAAIRPTVKDRRPLLGFHTKYPRLAVFNGLGTKGASLAPYWAHHFAQVIAGNQTLDPEVDILRFPIFREGDSAASATMK